MKVSDYLASVIGSYCPFVVQGGAAVHLIDSLARGGHRYVCAAHEQAAGFAADGFGKVRGLGVAVTTCGPGACNLLTSAASSYFEGAPVLYLVGQQHVFQEMDVVGAFRGVTRYAKQVTDPASVVTDLHDALRFARKGPALLNIFDEVYYAEIEVAEPSQRHDLGAWSAEPYVAPAVDAAEPVIFGNKRRALPVEAAWWMEQEAARGSVNPYHFMRALDAAMGSRRLVTDIGNHGVWARQYRSDAITDNNFGSMGYAIAAAMGVCAASGSAVVVTGDGSIQMNIQELATIVKHDMDVKIFVLNDAGYGMIRKTQDRWLAGRHSGCDMADLPRVDFERVATAYGVPNRRWDFHEDCTAADFAEVFSMKGPVLVNVTVSPEMGVY